MRPSWRSGGLAGALALAVVAGLGSLAQADAPVRLGEAPVALRDTVRHDTLWAISGALRPPPDVSRHQVMAALLRRNPDAFVGGNMFFLRPGAALTAPSLAEARAEPAEQALALERNHRKLWQARRQEAPPIYALGPGSVAAAGGTPSVPPAAGVVSPPEPVPQPLEPGKSETQAPATPSQQPLTAAPPVPSTPETPPSTAGTAPPAAGSTAASAPAASLPGTGEPARDGFRFSPSLLIALLFAGAGALWFARRRYPEPEPVRGEAAAGPERGDAAASRAPQASLDGMSGEPPTTGLSGEAARRSPIHADLQPAAFAPIDGLEGTPVLVTREGHAAMSAAPPDVWENTLKLQTAETCHELGQTAQAHALLEELFAEADPTNAEFVRQRLAQWFPSAEPPAAASDATTA